MMETPAGQVIQKVKQAALLYHRLILIVAPSGEGKTAVLRAVKRRTGAPLINVNLELCRRLLELTGRQRALQLPRILEEVAGKSDEDLILLDNIEVIFDVGLEHDPLRLLQGLSRMKTVVSAWNGDVVDGFLIYAAPDHPEYRRYPVEDFLWISPKLET